MALQWAPGHDNEAGYVDVLPNTAGVSVAFVNPIRYPVYVRAANGTVKAKGSPRTEIVMENVSFTDYTTMRETDLGYSSAESDITINATVSLPEPDQTTFNDWNVLLSHRPGVDTTLDALGGIYERVVWTVEIVEAT